MAQSCPEAQKEIETNKDVIAAVATAPGESAIGVVRLSGRDSLAVASSFVRWAHRGLSPRTATLAKAYAGGHLLDQVVVTFFPGPRSYTGEDVIEIAAHGSPFVTSHLLKEACRNGARPAEPGEFSRRAFLNGRLDLPQAEAVCSLIRARTRLAHRTALEQLEGGLSRKVHFLQTELLALLAAIEANLDHPDEDIPELGEIQTSEGLSRIRLEIDGLINSYRFGKLAMEGVRVAIVGVPNVGKSSLLNALLGRDRAIVTDVPGTTRDTLEESADLDGLKAVLIDTAGLRKDARDPVERIGMERARGAMEKADLILIVVDRSRPLNDEEYSLFKEIAALTQTSLPPLKIIPTPSSSPTRGEELFQLPVIVVFNKSDLPPQVRSQEIRYPWPCIEISALQGSGIDALIRAISNSVALPSGGNENDVVLISLRHRQALEDALQAVDRAKISLADGELAALALREALAAVGSIIGETTSEEVLHAIFSKFCIGK